MPSLKDVKPTTNETSSLAGSSKGMDFVSFSRLCSSKIMLCNLFSLLVVHAKVWKLKLTTFTSYGQTDRQARPRKNPHPSIQAAR